MPPANILCTNKTSVNSINISFNAVPLKYIHGYLKGYRIQYRLLRIGLSKTTQSSTKSILISPFKNKWTLSSLSSNSVYAIQVMAVNEHGDGVKSPITYAGVVVFITVL